MNEVGPPDQPSGNARRPCHSRHACPGPAAALLRRAVHFRLLAAECSAASAAAAHYVQQLPLLGKASANTLLLKPPSR